MHIYRDTVYKLDQHYILPYTLKLYLYSQAKTTPLTKKHCNYQLCIMPCTHRYISCPPFSKSCLCHTSHVCTKQLCVARGKQNIVMCT